VRVCSQWMWQGHFVQLKRPDEVNETLMVFLERLGHLRGQPPN
jgi:hypothetical protein